MNLLKIQNMIGHNCSIYCHECENELDSQSNDSKSQKLREMENYIKGNTFREMMILEK